MIQCFKCHREPSEIHEYLELAEDDDITPDEAAIEDGTYNPENGLFACTECYVSIGCPSSKDGWRPEGEYNGEL